MTRPLQMFLALFNANLHEFLRDVLAAFFSFFFPLMFVLLFGIVQGNRPTVTYRVGVVDQEHSPTSEQLVSVLSEQDAIKVVSIGSNEDPDVLRDQDLSALLVIPPGSLSGQDATPVALFTDRSDTTRVAYLETALNAAQAELTARATEAEPIFTYETVEPARKPINDFTFLLPGMMALALLQLGLFATATPLIQGRDRGTLRLLAITPVSSTALFMAQLVLRFIMAALQIALVLGVGMMLFDIQLVGSWAALAGVAALGAAMFISIGYAVAGVVPTAQSGQAIVLLLNFAMLFFGGLFFDNTTSPWLEWIGRIFPVTYLGDLFRTVVTGAPADNPVWVSVAVLAGWTVLATVVATRTFRFDMRRA
ncbi:MAG: hypothetical protein GEU75_15390 [Dehalococcoidia bacterium]|nr:hypothetical protein [Dehalococcoidia bacterium]